MNVNHQVGQSGLPSDAATPGGPLAGVRVLEVSSVVMAPFAGRLMAKMGADVIRVEPPAGDVMRHTGASRREGMTGVTMVLWDGKQSVAIDAKTASGQHELESLIREADIIITNHLPRRRARFGLDWEAVRRVNPRAILCTAQGYATGSEMADAPAYDDTVQAASGVCDLYRRSTGQPRYAPYIMADKVCGLTIVYSCLAALHHREVTGEGQWVDVPMVDVMVDFNLAEQLNDYTFEPPLGDAGWHRTLAPSRQPHPCRDGWICILPYSDRDWREFLDLAGVSVDDASPPYATNRERNANMEQVQQIIADYAKDRDLAEILRDCGERSIPVQAVTALEDLVTDPYLRARGTIALAEHPTEGMYWRTSPNIGFSASPLRPPRMPSDLDSDRATVFTDPTEHSNTTERLP